MRPTYGAAAITSGGITAVEPMVVPTRKRVRPSTHTMSIRKGTERSMFTTTSSVLYSTGRGLMPSGAEVVSSTPMGRPSR